MTHYCTPRIKEHKSNAAATFYYDVSPGEKAATENIEADVYEPIIVGYSVRRLTLDIY